MLVVASPATGWATEAEPEGSSTTAAPSSGIEPADEVPPVEEEAEDVPWTTRFLAPATLALGVLGVIGAAIYYGMRIAGRYRVGG